MPTVASVEICGSGTSTRGWPTVASAEAGGAIDAAIGGGSVARGGAMEAAIGAGSSAIGLAEAASTKEGSTAGASAKVDSDLDPIRDEPAFQQLVND